MSIPPRTAIVAVCYLILSGLSMGLLIHAIHIGAYTDALFSGAIAVLTMSAAINLRLGAIADRLEAADADALKHEEDYKAMYMDLLMQVGNKCRGESRHDTAKRYIVNAENSGDNTAKCGAQEVKLKEKNT